jgi:hypothetical protein
MDQQLFVEMAHLVTAQIIVALAPGTKELELGTNRDIA